MNAAQKKAVRDELEYRLRTVASTYIFAGRHSEQPDKAVIERHVEDGLACIVEKAEAV